MPEEFDPLTPGSPERIERHKEWLRKNAPTSYKNLYASAPLPRRIVCLDPWEIARLTNGESLPDGRMSHFEACEDCQDASTRFSIPADKLKRNVEEVLATLQAAPSARAKATNSNTSDGIGTRAIAHPPADNRLVGLLALVSVVVIGLSSTRSTRAPSLLRSSIPSETPLAAVVMEPNRDITHFKRSPSDRGLRRGMSQAQVSLDSWGAATTSKGGGSQTLAVAILADSSTPPPVLHELQNMGYSVILTPKAGITPEVAFTRDEKSTAANLPARHFRLNYNETAAEPAASKK